MRDLLVVTPSRGRPEQLRAMIDACLSLSEADTEIAVGNDDDDLYDLTGYTGSRHERVTWHHGPRTNLAGWTNRLAAYWTIKRARAPKERDWQELWRSWMTVAQDEALRLAKIPRNSGIGPGMIQQAQRIATG